MISPVLANVYLNALDRAWEAGAAVAVPELREILPRIAATLELQPSAARPSARGCTEPRSCRRTEST